MSNSIGSIQYVVSDCLCHSIYRRKKVSKERGRGAKKKKLKSNQLCWHICKPMCWAHVWVCDQNRLHRIGIKSLLKHQGAPVYQFPITIRLLFPPSEATQFEAIDDMSNVWFIVWASVRFVGWNWCQIKSRASPLQHRMSGSLRIFFTSIRRPMMILLSHAAVSDRFPFTWFRHLNAHRNPNSNRKDEMDSFSIQNPSEIE